MKDIDRLAERMAEYDEGSVTAGRAIGLPSERAKGLFKEMRRKLGSQAR